MKCKQAFFKRSFVLRFQITAFGEKKSFKSVLYLFNKQALKIGNIKRHEFLSQGSSGNILHRHKLHACIYCLFYSQGPFSFGECHKKIVLWYSFQDLNKELMLLFKNFCYIASSFENAPKIHGIFLFLGGLSQLCNWVFALALNKLYSAQRDALEIITIQPLHIFLHLIISLPCISIRLQLRVGSFQQNHLTPLSTQEISDIAGWSHNFRRAIYTKLFKP